MHTHKCNHVKFYLAHSQKIVANATILITVYSPANLSTLITYTEPANQDVQRGVTGVLKQGWNFSLQEGSSTGTRFENPGLY